ncbi:MAG: dTDP-4-dehydrorhamnose 3,5-epimerase family protein [Ignavibacteriales bacterium]|nr:dTDP-4-dehydrorhamnose 3,5-epimerase family protein [Ignavibacteriales bacterium]
MKFIAGVIQDVVVKELTKYSDSRGWLQELFRSDEIEKQFVPVMGYVSSTEVGIARGPHEHRDQADFFCFLGPSTFKVYLWDTRNGSATYLHKMIIEAGEKRPCSIIIPAGVVHAYKNIGSTAGWVINLPNKLYAGEARKSHVDEIRHESDPNTIFILD